MNLRELMTTEILSINHGEEFGETELNGLEEIELFQLFMSIIRRDAWERGFENGHSVGYDDCLRERDDVIQIEVAIPNPDKEENTEEN